jgi:glycosyltransferase involved in cell wall biosynthesis
MKNPDKIIDALHIIGPAWLEEHRVRVIIAGKGEMENELRERAGRAGVQEYLSLPGLVTREDIPDYYNIADVYIISSDYEGTSLSLMEAMFNKLAIIASNAPGINGMLTHEQNALLYETKNANHLADTIKRVFSDPGLADRLATSAYAGFRAKYSYESMIEKYMAIFSSV